MKRFIQGIISFTLILSLIGCTQSENPDASRGEEAITLTLAEVHVAGHPIAKTMDTFARSVYDKTEGRVVIDVLAAGEAGTENTSIARVRSGELDLARVSAVTLIEYSPNYTPLTLPFVFNSREHMWAYATSDYGREILENTQGCDALAWVENGARCFYANVPVYSPTDMDNRYFRIPISQVMTSLLHAYGARATNIELSTVYTAINEGSLNGAENDIISYAYYANDLVAPYYTWDCHSYAPSLIIAGSHLKDKLGEEDYEILRQCALDTEALTRSLWDSREKEIVEDLTGRGVTFITPTEEAMAQFRKGAEQVYDLYPEYGEVIEQIQEFKY